MKCKRAQVVGHLPSKLETLSSISSTTKKKKIIVRKQINKWQICYVTLNKNGVNRLSGTAASSLLQPLTMSQTIFLFQMPLLKFSHLLLRDQVPASQIGQENLSRVFRDQKEHLKVPQVQINYPAGVSPVPVSGTATTEANWEGGGGRKDSSRYTKKPCLGTYL
jgi:hypothetical protein